MEKKFLVNEKVSISNKALVLLSTYNGENYIEELLDSLLGQTYPIDILIRDDGSSDNTYNIVLEYQKKYDNIYFISGENKGFVKSFTTLVCEKRVEHYQWIAFCDQDDIWLPDKVERAVNALKKYKNQRIPLMYCSNLQVVDSKLNHIGKMQGSRFSISRTCIYVQNIAVGCTIVFNHAAAEAYKMGAGNTIEAHDYFMLFLCRFLGRVYYDSNAYILYRQHLNNVYGADKMTLFKGIRNVLADWVHPKKETRIDAVRDFVKTYQQFLSAKDISFLETFMNYKKNILYRLNLVLNPTIAGSDIKTTIAFKVRVLFGRMY